MKKLALLLITLVLFTGAFSVTAFADDTVSGGFTVTGDNSNYSYDTSSGVLTISGSGAVTIKNTDITTATSHRISVAGRTTANITLEGVNIENNNNPPIDIQYNATANITLKDGTTNTLVGKNSTALHVPYYATLIINGDTNGTGILNARVVKGSTDNWSHAGIGSNNTEFDGAGAITINGGVVNATGGASVYNGDGGAGIGAGSQVTTANNCTITINGGTVTATAGGDGENSTYEVPGIGSRGHSTINITAGTVIATSGAEDGSGLLGYTVTISGGTVTATASGSGGTGLYAYRMTIANTMQYATSDSPIGEGATYTKGTGVVQDDFGSSQYAKVIKAPTYAVNVATPTNGTVAISPNDPVTADTIVTITATPSTGYKVDTVTVTDADSTNVVVSGTGNERTFTMPAKAVNVNVTFVALPKLATPTILPNGGGFDTSVSVTITSETGATIYYTTNGTDPTPTNGTVYTGAFNVTADNTTVKAIAIKADMTNSDVATATFTENTYTVTVTNGTTDKATTAKDDTVTITANAAPVGQQFKNWTVNSGGVTLANADSARTTFTMKTQNVSLTANYEDIPPTVTGVTVSPSNITVQKGTTQQFNAGVQGINNPPQTVNWTVEGNANSGTSITASGLLTIAATETAATVTVRATSTLDNTQSGTQTVTVSDVPIIKYTVTPSTGANGTISPNAQQNVSVGSNVSFTFTPSTGYEVDTVTVDSTAVTPTTATGHTITNVQKNTTINVTFKAIPHSMVAGTGQAGQRGQSLSFTSDADYANLDSVKVDGTQLTRGTQYIDREGSTIITLQGSYTSTLAPGVHTIEIISTTGVATAQFTITGQATPTPTPTPSNPAISPLTGVDGHENPQTGNNSNTPLFITLMLVSTLGLTTLFLTRKKYLSIRKK